MALKELNLFLPYQYTTAKTSPSNKVASTISNSVLAGEYRFYIEKSGVYKISKSFQELGINLNATNPKIKVLETEEKCYRCQITFITLQI
jgi:hypothetical protein